MKEILQTIKPITENTTEEDEKQATSLIADNK